MSCQGTLAIINTLHGPLHRLEIRADYPTLWNLMIGESHTVQKQ